MSLTGLGEVSDLATTIINKFWPDKTQAEKDQAALALQEYQGQLAQLQGQLEVDKAEASSASVFVAGWRPAVGWVCALAFGWTYVLAPIVAYAAKLAGSTVVLPVLDLSQLSPVLMGMLGLGVMRTYEKVNGIKAGH